MEKLTLRGRLRPRNWSLRQTMVILTALFLLGAILASVLLVATAEEGQRRIRAPYLREIEIAEGVHSVVLAGELTGREAAWDELLGAVILAGPILVFAAAILLEALCFYRLKLKRPIAVLEQGAARIAQNDLDFTITPTGGDEMGRLCAAFEAMRAGLEENSRELWRMVEERRRLNAAFAHDLRTPITVLKGYAGLLAAYLPEGGLPPERLLSTVGNLSDAVERLESYVETMSSMQKLEDARPEPRGLDAAQLAARLRDSLELLAGEGGKRASFAAGELGDELWLDEGFVFRVFENIAANAVRYAESRVWAELDVEEGALRLTVSDDGRGFTPEELRLALNPFYRDPDRPAGPHLGLGLNIAKTLCEKHGGSLVLSAAPGGGACVTARFRLERPSEG